MNAPLDSFAKTGGQTHRIEQPRRAPALAPHIPAHTRLMLRLAVAFVNDANPNDIRAYEDEFGNTQMHAERDAVLAFNLVTKQFPDSMTRTELSEFVVACVFHDIGKLKLNPEILFKKGSLSEEERSHIKKHMNGIEDYIKAMPVSAFNKVIGWMNFVYGMDLVSLDEKNSSHKANVLNIILQHHERLDGSGYPRGLKGDQLSMAGKILGLIGQYDGMVDTCRDYRENHFTNEAALDFIGSRNEKKFDREVFVAFHEMIMGSKPVAPQVQITFRGSDAARLLPFVI